MDEHEKLPNWVTVAGFLSILIVAVLIFDSMDKDIKRNEMAQILTNRTSMTKQEARCAASVALRWHRDAYDTWSQISSRAELNPDEIYTPKVRQLIAVECGAEL